MSYDNHKLTVETPLAVSLKPLCHFEWEKESLVQNTLFLSKTDWIQIFQYEQRLIWKIFLKKFLSKLPIQVTKLFTELCE